MTFGRSMLVALLLLILGMASMCRAVEPVRLKVDYSRTNGVIRALHGVNKGPLGPGGLLDLTAEHRALGIPLTRLHDCYWPNPYVVDIHVIFPDFKADPANPASYDFRLTDEYIAAVRATGAQIVYRLGESIEHTTVRRHVHPPADFEKWSTVCLGIIRHYNGGWANGFHHEIRYWEIWNEPENRPAMWSGSDEDYFRLYRVAASTIKQSFPNLKVGGPAVGASGQFVKGAFQPTAFVSNFLKLCRTESLPLDFFSWHSYTDNVSELVARAKAIRQLLDQNGFAITESHLNEWNYLPGNSWTPGSRKGAASDRERYYGEMAGMPGASFITAALIALQDAPLDAANLFHGEAGAFGLFNEFGVPQKNYHAVRAFHELVKDQYRVATEGALAGQIAVAAARNSSNHATVLISNYHSERPDVLLELENIPWPGGSIAEVRVLDASRNLDLVRSETVSSASTILTLKVPGQTVVLVQLRPRNPGQPASASLIISSPSNRIVYQRDNKGFATVAIAGTSSLIGAKIEARVIPIGQTNPMIAWKPVTTVGADGAFRGALNTAAGWYRLEVRAGGKDGAEAVAGVDRFGVGEVFIVVGHSVAQGGDLNLPGADDDRVSTVALIPSKAEYEATGDPRWLPPLTGSQFGSGVRPAPFGHGTYFWARFGEIVARKENVPVLVLNAAFGGTSLEHWAKSARGEEFQHSFVKSAIRMPYINLRNTLLRYITVTGLRAILADQGQNDANELDSNVVFQNYRAWVDQARKDLRDPRLAIIVNRQTPYIERIAIRAAQERMIQEVPDCFPGPDYDSLPVGARPDRIHLSVEGAEMAARLWAKALDGEFFGKSVPFQAKPIGN